MKKIIVFFTFLASFSVFSIDVEGGKWEHLYKKDQLDFYSKAVKKSDILAFSAKGTIKISLIEMLAILRDVEGTKRWDANSSVKKTIRNISDVEADTYSVSTMPWPITDRDLVMNNKLRLDLKNNFMIVDAYSVKHKDYPKNDDKVRARMGIARFKIRPVSEEVTYIEMYVHIDPRGSIPSWMVNIVQQDMPYDYLQNLQKFAKTVDEKPNPGVTRLYNEFMKHFNDTRK
jgi:hypothetical protein